MCVSLMEEKKNYNGWHCIILHRKHFKLRDGWARDPGCFLLASSTSLMVAGWLEPMMAAQNYQLFQPGDDVSLAVVS